jgi:hypothetical protein
VNGHSQEAVNCLNEGKKKLFIYIEEYLSDNDKNGLKSKNSTFGSMFIDDNKKKRKKKRSKNKDYNSFQKLFKNFTKNAYFMKTLSNKNAFSKGKKIKVNISKKFEPFFLSNFPFNINNFLNQYQKIYNIKIDEENEEISSKATFNKTKIRQMNHKNSRRSFLQLAIIDKNHEKRIPIIFKNPLLIREELLLAEIELDRKNYRNAYAYINHALAIISLFKKIKNSDYLNKYKIEQKLIKEFLTILDNTNIKNESFLSDREEDREEDNEEGEYFDLESKDEEIKKEHELQEKIKINKKILAEIEKFFIFFSTLSAYQIKILNETQPKTEKKNYLPILFQNQFKDCLTIPQIEALENIHIMSLSRYMILKDPNKLILPKNLNIYPVYLEKPELFTPRYFMENSRNNTEEKRQKDIIQKKAYKNFQKIINSERSTLYIQNFLNSNFNLVMKIIKKSTQKEIDKMIENPNILINPVEEYNKKNPKNSRNNLL